jgi:hypothetical protein
MTRDGRMARIDHPRDPGSAEMTSDVYHQSSSPIASLLHRNIAITSAIFKPSKNDG